ncbi:MAG: HAMP domain-containing sensor histidine kinase [Cyanobacteria bacterium P01_F01_bin.150]
MTVPNPIRNEDKPTADTFSETLAPTQPVKTSPSSKNLIQKGWILWQRWLKETRTRVLLIYALSMLGVTAISIPIFRTLLFAQVGDRVQSNLLKEIDEFQDEYRNWVTTVSPTDREMDTNAALRSFIDDFIREESPEDDNYHLFFLNNGSPDSQFYRATPPALPDIIHPESELVNEWLTQSLPEKPNNESRLVIRGEDAVADSEIGSILYKVIALNIDNQRQGLYIAAHFTAGERREAFGGVYIFAAVALWVVLVSFLLAWVGSRQLFAPVRSLATAARSIGRHNLSERLNVQGRGELADLSSTFNAMMSRLETAFETQRKFINDASHELRTPITIIRGHLELMGTDPAEQRETLTLVMDELDRMTRSVTDLLLLAKAERPDFLRIESIDVEAFTEDVYQKAIALAPRQWSLVNKGTGIMMGDRHHIAGAILNLIGNAIKYTHEADTIEVGSSCTHRKIQFWIRDTGEGIDLSDQTRIFQRFARASHSSGQSEGAGLGLAIVKAVVEAHQGHVELTSQPGVGSNFTLVFPLEID